MSDRGAYHWQSLPNMKIDALELMDIFDALAGERDPDKLRVMYEQVLELYEGDLYQTGDYRVDDLLEQVEMTPDVSGTWVATVEGDLNGVYYTYCVDVDGETVETNDPYSVTTGVNGNRAMIKRKAFEKYIDSATVV